MSIDIANLFQTMATSAGDELQEDGADIGNNLLEILNNNKESLTELVEAHATGEIDQDEFDIELEREKSILEAEMISLEIASKAAIQKAVNSAINTLTSAVNAAL